jgi:hypothetical protein
MRDKRYNERARAMNLRGEAVSSSSSSSSSSSGGGMDACILLLNWRCQGTRPHLWACLC